MEIMTLALNNLGLNASLFKSKNVLQLTVKGVDNVFNNLFPLLEKYSHFLYWKLDSFNFLCWVKQLVDVGGHHTYLGLKALTLKIYSNTNERFIDKEVWCSRLNVWLQSGLFLLPIVESEANIIYILCMLKVLRKYEDDKFVSLVL